MSSSPEWFKIWQSDRWLVNTWASLVLAQVRELATGRAMASHSTGPLTTPLAFLVTAVEGAPGHPPQPSMQCWAKCSWSAVACKRWLLLHIGDVWNALACTNHAAPHPLQTVPPNLDSASLGRFPTRKVKQDSVHMLCPSIQHFVSHIHIVKMHWMYGWLVSVGSKEWCWNSVTNSCSMKGTQAWFLTEGAGSSAYSPDNSEAYLCKTGHLPARFRATWKLCPPTLSFDDKQARMHRAMAFVHPVQYLPPGLLSMAVEGFAKMW